MQDNISKLKKYQSTKETYSSSSSSELSAERSKSGSPLVRRGGGVGSLARLAGAAAVERGRVRWVVGGGGAGEGAGGRRRRRGSGQRGELARGNLTNGAPAVGAPLVIFFYIAMAHRAEVRH